MLFRSLSLSTAFELAHLSSDMVYRRPMDPVSIRRSADLGARHQLAMLPGTTPPGAPSEEER